MMTEGGGYGLPMPRPGIMVLMSVPIRQAPGRTVLAALVATCIAGRPKVRRRRECAA